MQDSHLFDETIAENLRYGKSTASREEMEIACRVANADEFIKKLPKVLIPSSASAASVFPAVKNNASPLPRTVLKSPKVLILDRATSALDSHSEMLVQDALWKLIKAGPPSSLPTVCRPSKKRMKLSSSIEKIAEQGTRRTDQETRHLLLTPTLSKPAKWKNSNAGTSSPRPFP